jgi:serine phosphatase RsbU (regulator of sigma subunit)
LNDLAARLEESVRKRGAQKSATKGVHVVGAAINNIHDLFTHGVTGVGMKDLFHRELRETLLFYMREIDFEALRQLPWFKRYPLAAWKIFVATAYRLSPPRRIAFAIATLAVFMGAIQMLITLGHPQDQGSGIIWWAIALAIYIFLLLMELRDKLDLKGDLEIAREIQIALVPSRPFSSGKIAIFSHTRPANTVGGDYHDIIELGAGRIGVVTGDVAGKGIPAALLMALLQGSLRTLITAGFRGPELVRKLNEYLFDNIPTNRLVTLFYGELEPTTGALWYVNAGHNAPFLLQNASVKERLPATSVVLGVLRDAAFEEKETRLEPGDRLLLFTDGVSEAFNQHEEEYGEERLERFLQNHGTMGEDELIFAIIKDVLAFCDSARPGDDMTLMCIRHM